MCCIAPREVVESTYQLSKLVEGSCVRVKIKNDLSPALFYFHGGSGGLGIGISLWVCGVWSGPALMLFIPSDGQSRGPV